jgi:membrane-associated phospholipid phosphatase
LLIIVNFFYKASGHGSAVAGPVTALNIILPGCWGLLSIPLLALVAWARVTTKEHDLKQVLVGMVLGLVATLQSFLLIKPL